ncbi:hypothetical protein CVT24_006796 [Panaeolus cyanescens]|uniref:triacylglycerol lipase n=1 Tax=Panaeolus cyanescens TaxID=181874 RepID=A0A409V9A9_9AGAR|nr:hypothetical protein CVT24_006796 [Panaeolus cyanescens]
MLTHLSLLLTLLSLQSFSYAVQHSAQFSFQSDLTLEGVDSDDPAIAFTPSPVVPLPSTSVTLKTVPTTVYKPRSLDALHNNRLRSLRYKESSAEALIWDPVQVQAPDVGDLHTLAQLARMAGNAYALPGRKNWYEVDHAWNRSFPFGWEADDGFRGHVFLSSDNSTIVLSIKGTTLQGPTSRKDKFNDNLLFSCCCARVDFSWVLRTVCDCYANHWRCDNQCLTDALIQDSLFYSIGVKLVDDLLKIYPGSHIWLVGHSLGGALASLLGATYGLPAVAFESPGEKLAATRLHLPLPPPISFPAPTPSAPTSLLAKPFKLLFPRLKFPFPPGKPKDPSIPEPSQPAPSPLPSGHPIATTHVYHTADPIPQGSCTGFGSPCAQAGYALETRCHLGQSIIFDTVNKMGWPVDVSTHVIKQVITRVLEGDTWWGEDDDKPDKPGDGDKEDPKDPGWDWPWHSSKKGSGEGKHKDKEGKRDVPLPVQEDDCVDCFKWQFGDYKDDNQWAIAR